MGLRQALALSTIVLACGSGCGSCLDDDKSAPAPAPASSSAANAARRSKIISGFVLLDAGAAPAASAPVDTHD